MILDKATDREEAIMIVQSGVATIVRSRPQDAAALRRRSLSEMAASINAVIDAGLAHPQFTVDGAALVSDSILSFDLTWDDIDGPRAT